MRHSMKMDKALKNLKEGLLQNGNLRIVIHVHNYRKLSQRKLVAY